VRLPKAIKFSETEKSYVWRIAKLQTYNARQKTMSNSGKNLLLSVRKNQPDKLYFWVKEFYFGVGGVSSVNSDSSYYIFSIKNGKLNLYQRNPTERTVRNKNQKPNGLGIPIKADPVVYRRFLAVLKDFLIKNNYKFLPKISVKGSLDFSREIQTCIYPGLRTLGKDVSLMRVDPKIFRNKLPFKEMVKIATGSKGKKTVKLFAENIETFKTTRVFELAKNKGLVPLETPKQAPYRKLLRNFEQDSRIRLVKEVHDTTRVVGLVRDTVKFYSEHPCEIPRNLKPCWHDLHNYIYRQHQKRIRPVEEFKYEDKILGIHGACEDNLSIRLPQNSHDLIDWGNELSHCVGSYGSMVAQKRCTIFGVFKEEKIKYCLQVTGRKVVQFRGKHNCSPEKEDSEKVIRVLKERGLVDVSENEPAFW